MLRQPFQLPSDHFAQRAVSQFLANCINSQFCLQLEEKRKMKKNHQHHQFCGNHDFGHSCSAWQ